MMKIRVLVILLFLLMVMLRVQAEAPQWRLKTPRPDEYLTALPEILAQWEKEIPDDSQYKYDDFVLMRWNDINQFGSSALAELPFEMLYHALDRLLRADLTEDTAVDVLNTALVMAWLHEHPIDLDKTQTFRFKEYEVEVVPRDFNQDGKNEWVLKVFQDISGENSGRENNSNYVGYYFRFLVVQRDSQNHYHLIETPLPAVVGGTHHGSDGTFEEVDFTDVNADGKPEWIVAELSAGGQFSPDRGALYVLQWQHNSLALLTENISGEPISYWSAGWGFEGYYPRGVRVEIANLDDDAALEIRVNTQTADNWGCQWVISETHDWDGTSYLFVDVSDEYADSPGCAWMRAETAFQKADYQQAITYYEDGLRLLNTPQTGEQRVFVSGQNHELVQYIKARLILAHILNGQKNLAEGVLNELQAEEPSSDFIAMFIQTLADALEEDSNPFYVCTAVYNAFREQTACESEADSSCNFKLSTQLIVGMTQEDDGLFGLVENSVSPSDAGCNISMLLNTALKQHTWSMHSSPQDQLNALGIRVKSTFHTDLNGDSLDEWLIWPEAAVNPLFFVSQGDDYLLSRADVRFPDEHSQLVVRAMPDNSGMGLVRLQNGLGDLFADDSQWLPRGDCTPHADPSRPPPDPTGLLEMWRLKGSQLERIQDTIPLCESMSMEDIFTEGGDALQAWAYSEPLRYIQPDVNKATYVWDTQQQRYKPAALAIPTRIDLYNIRFAWNYQHYDDMLKIVEAYIANFVPDHPFASYEIHAAYYYRALALEALNRPDEALAEYLTIYRVAPESSWGKLARLHFSCVQGCS